MKIHLQKLVNKVINLEDYVYLIILLAAFLHISFLILFYFMNINELFYLNIVSVLIYITITINFKTKYARTYYMIVYFEVLIHQLIAIYYTGSASGFDLLLCCLILVQFLFFKKSTCFLSTIMIICLIYVSYFQADSLLLHSNKLFTIDIYKNSNIILYPINLAVLLVFLIVYGVLVTVIPSKRINDLTKIVYKDFLTGLNNRKYIEDVVLSKYNQENILVAIADIDNFKHINDTYGHQTGDIVLKMLAIVLINKNKKYAKYNVDICRWGGEEFLIIADINDTDIANMFLNEIREDIFRLKISDLHETISVTIGASISSFNPKEYKQMFEIADKNLYVGKNTGKNKCVITKA
ncbi:diguanylate cyclase [Campylobacter sp. RM5004]|uniref:GGDEF domain-containing protein n=1 Tax=Campylobacter sp. RM5004 TaxID=1660078 RepID=UPI001EFC238D|nr:GGDEF domain-containing protein [Campylobacter sp. RM5004]ULO01568.1 diguanylate cyclase [Campylobacter sp. RM5004]